MNRLITPAALLALASGCEDLTDFDTTTGEAYCGAVTLAAAYRVGFSPRVQMRLGSFDASKIETGESPGLLSTYDAGEDVPQMFVEVPLRPIPAMMHDPLSQLQFGDGREKNLIYAVSPTDPTAESLVAVVSLRSDDSVEVRLIRPGASDENVAPSRRQLFGLFSLTRQDGNCGF